MDTYEKKYKEALERATKAKNNASLSNGTLRVLGIIFPELKESEEERIRKALIEYFKSYKEIGTCGAETFSGIPTDNILAWLEKEGKEEYALKSSKHEDVYKFMEYIEKRAKSYEFNLPNRGYDIYAFAKDILVWLEKQSEQKPTLRERYENIAQSEWFKKTHDGMSVSGEESKWTEEDENYCNEAIGFLDTLCEYLEDSSSEFIEPVQNTMRWLESIKKRLEE